ncbi:MAG TPA: hypothetical protein VJT75_11555 [Thermoleophilaceae bacterium]|nr:hypothetical protein [Thermoleophilaceae bacterium]
MRRGLIRGAQPRARTVALGLAISGTAIAFILFMTQAFGGTDDADLYGRVKLPGKKMLDLPAGKVALYYEERVTLDEDDSLDVPDGLRVVAKRELRKIRSERGVPNSINLDGRSLREWGKLDVPAAGRYRVRTRSKERGSNSPAVTLGKGQLEGLARAGVRAGIAEGAGLVLALLVLLLWRRPDEEPPAVPPPASGATPTSIRV